VCVFFSCLVSGVTKREKTVISQFALSPINLRFRIGFDISIILFNDLYRLFSGKTYLDTFTLSPISIAIKSSPTSNGPE
jgi:hypothetical protein